MDIEPNQAIGMPEEDADIEIRLRELASREQETYGGSEDEFIQGIGLFITQFKPKVDVIYYPGSNAHIGPSKVRGFESSRIIYLDQIEGAVEALQKAGYEAHVGDAEEFDPGQVDIAILMNFYAQKPVEAIVQGGYVICNAWGGGVRHMNQNKDFELVGLTRWGKDQKILLDTEDVNDCFEDVKTEAEWKEKSPYSYELTVKAVDDFGITGNLFEAHRKLEEEGRKVMGMAGFTPDGRVLASIPKKKEADMFFYRRKIPISKT